MPEAEKILRVERNIAWLPRPNEGQIVLASQLPPQKLVTTAFALAFMNDHLLMTNLSKRGWDIPGGHVEPGEQLEETVRREVHEETGALLASLHLLGYQRLRLLGPRPREYRYPYPESYQVIYWTQVIALENFSSTTETQGRALFPPPEARALSWVQHHLEWYELALTKVTS